MKQSAGCSAGLVAGQLVVRLGLRGLLVLLVPAGRSGLAAVLLGARVLVVVKRVVLAGPRGTLIVGGGGQGVLRRRRRGVLRQGKTRRDQEHQRQRTEQGREHGAPPWV